MKIEYIVYALGASFLLATVLALFDIMRLRRKPRGEKFTLSVHFGREHPTATK